MVMSPEKVCPFLVLMTPESARSSVANNRPQNPASSQERNMDFSKGEQPSILNGPPEAGKFQTLSAQSDAVNRSAPLCLAQGALAVGSSLMFAPSPVRRFRPPNRATTQTSGKIANST